MNTKLPHRINIDREALEKIIADACKKSEIEGIRRCIEIANKPLYSAEAATKMRELIRLLEGR